CRHENAAPRVARPIASLDPTRLSRPEETSAVHSLFALPRLWQTGALRMRLCRPACRARSPNRRSVPRAAVRSRYGLAGLLQQPQALPRRRPVLVGARHQRARPRLAAMASVRRFDGGGAHGDARPASSNGLSSGPRWPRDKGKFIELRARWPRRSPGSIAAARDAHPTDELGAAVAIGQPVMRLPDLLKRRKLRVRTPLQKAWPRHRRWV